MHRHYIALKRNSSLVSVALLLAMGCSDSAVVSGPAGPGADGSGANADGLVADASDTITRAPDSGPIGPLDTGVTPPPDAGSVDAGPTLPGELVALTLSPPLATLTIGATLPFELIGKFADGKTSPLADLAKWSTSNPAAVTISPLGVALATGAGEATIEAAIAGHIAKATVTVTPLKVTKLVIDPPSAEIGRASCRERV